MPSRTLDIRFFDDRPPLAIYATDPTELTDWEDMPPPTLPPLPESARLAMDLDCAIGILGAQSGQQPVPPGSRRVDGDERQRPKVSDV